MYAIFEENIKQEMSPEKVCFTGALMVKYDEEKVKNLDQTLVLHY